MAFTYHPPTRTTCKVCEAIAGKHERPLITTAEGRASGADRFPIHNWYNFVLGYTPKFPEYITMREQLHPGAVIADPFMGSGTTNVCAKQHGFASIGIDANDYFYFAAKTKLNWEVDITAARKAEQALLEKYAGALATYDFSVRPRRDQALPERYISDVPLAKLLLLKEVIATFAFPHESIKDLVVLAFTAIAVPASNISYGPGFGVKKPKADVDVYTLFKTKLDRMLSDLETINPAQRLTSAQTYLGDARHMTDYMSESSVDIIITSPPYPGDHEYTKHSKLELIFADLATNLDEFRVIKKRMVRGSTTNIYKEDSDGELVRDIASIKAVTDEIFRRLEVDGATSGFEKLYTKLVWEYFGGMYKVFQEAYKVLKPGGKCVLLVSDSHAFKMVHIKTAELLAEVAGKAGLINPHIELWQNKASTSHKYNLFEEILTIERPR